MQTERAQSEIVGTILLVAIVVIGVTTIGSVLFLSFDQPAKPTAEVNATANATTLELTHVADEPIAVDELRLVVRNGTDEGRAAFADGSISTGDFTVADRWTAAWTTLGIDPNPDEKVTVVLVHDPSNSVVYRGTVVAG
ncbi:type IV pilin N-terminal domain-containing protein [Haloparvum sp. AD34]